MSALRVAAPNGTPSELVESLCRLAEAARREGAGAREAAAREAARDAADEDLRAAMELAAAGVSAEEILCRIEARVFALTLIGEGLAAIMSDEEPHVVRAQLGAMLGDQGRARLSWGRGSAAGTESPAA